MRKRSRLNILFTIAAAFSCLIVLEKVSLATGTAASYASSGSSTNTTAVFDFKALMGLISSHNVTTLDELIPLLPDDYKKYFVLMLQSGSLQSASPSSPRVVAYGSYAQIESISPGVNPDRLYLGFQSSSASQSKLPQTLEAIEWVAQKNSYNFYQIDFPITANSVKINPDTCRECHGDPLSRGNPLRPNWTAYPRWDGAFGNDGNIDGTFAAGLFITDLNTKAHSAIDAFVKNNDRLKSLSFDGFFTNNGLEYPNIYLSQKIAGQLQVRDVGVIQQSPDYQKLKYAFAGAFMSCYNFSDFFSPALIQTLQAGVFRNLINVPNQSATLPSDLSFEKLQDMTAPLIQKNGTHFSGFTEEAAITTWLRFLFEGRDLEDQLINILGSPPATPETPSWSYDFTGTGDRLNGLRDYFFQTSASDFPGVPALQEAESAQQNWMNNNYPTDETVLNINGADSDICQLLAAKSKSETQGYLPTTPQAPAALIPASIPPTSTQSPAILAAFHQYCASCHTGGERPLPLDNLDLLKDYPTDDGESVIEHLSSNMPPQFATQPSSATRQQMLDALKQ